MAGTLQDQLRRSVGYPKSREVWHINDRQIQLSDQGRDPKPFRPCLIISNTMVIRQQFECINVIPLSRSGRRTTLSPLCKDYERFVPNTNWQPSNRSKAIIPFYQPIKIDYFGHKLGVVTEECYDHIMQTLCMQVVGHICDAKSFDLSLD